MEDTINVSKNDINSSVEFLDKFTKTDVWSGEAASSMTQSISELMSLLETEQENLVTFQTALDKLEELKEIDSEIERLKSLIKSTPEDASEEQITSINSYNSYINGQIQSNTTKREKIREDIIGILAGFDVIADLSIIMIPDLDGATVIEKFDYGCIYELKTASGVRYQVYIPNEYTADTPLVVYDAGDSGNGSPNSTANWNLWVKDFSEDEVNAIVIRSRRGDTSSCYIDVIDKLGINPSKPIMLSHSGGTTKSSIIEYEDLMDEGYGKNGILGVMDGLTPGPWWESQGIVDKLEENNTIVIGIAQGNDGGKYGASQKGLAKVYPNVLILYDKSEYGNSHGSVNKSLTENDVLEYFTGQGELPDNYEIIRYNPSDPNADSEGFVTVNYEDVNTVDKVYELFGIENE